MGWDLFLSKNFRHFPVNQGVSGPSTQKKVSSAESVTASFMVGVALALYSARME